MSTKLERPVSFSEMETQLARHEAAKPRAIQAMRLDYSGLWLSTSIPSLPIVYDANEKKDVYVRARRIACANVTYVIR